MRTGRFGSCINHVNVGVPGPVVMNTEGFTEKGIKRKAAVQGLFSKLLYLSEVSSLQQ